MSSSTSPPNSEDELLARVLRELEQGASLDACLAAHPQLASQVRELFQMRRVLDRSRPDANEPPPERLGEFRVVRRIARGGMGEIYEAVQERLNGRRVAVKVIRRGRISPEARDRFLREQAVLARLHQTHIVPIHAAGEEGPLQYFAMPYIDGAALHHVVHTARRLGSSQPGSHTPSVARLAELAASEDRNRSRPSEAAPSRAAGAASTRPESPGPGEGGPGAPGEGRLRLSQEYFRSAARVLADAAEAMHHAHEANVIHRDLKPSNLMVDTAGQCWVIDFGLAGYLNGRDEAAPAEEPGPEPAPVSGVMGTLNYMAPEQFDQKADARTDVWGLGATLYELLTLHPAFDGRTEAEVRKQIESQEPRPPRERVSNVPADLAAISLKALRKEPAQRYPTALDLADDLRRWLRTEPVSARPAWPLRRMWLWARRNKGWATAITLGVFVVIVGVFGATGFAVYQERQSSIQRALTLRLTARSSGWSDDAWGYVRRAARIYKDDELRNEAAAILVGLDARTSKEFKGDASSVAFDSKGERLLIGGSANQPARLWPRPTGEEVSSKVFGAGPVAFGADGTPLQLVAKDTRSLLLWDVSRQQVVREFKIPGEGKPEALTPLNTPILALSPDGTVIAASVHAPGKKGLLIAWDVAGNKQLLSEQLDATTLAISPRGDDKQLVLAAGQEDGRIRLWSLPKGETIASESLRTGRLPIQGVAFGRNPVRHASENGRRPGSPDWLLAVGNSGGTVVIWDLATGALKASCPGSYHSVYALAFSVDGTILASTGRAHVRLWDVATGRPLLQINSRNTLISLAFAPDARSLAVSSLAAHGYSGGVDVWELEYGRGIQSLHGLSGQVSKVWFSPDGILLAALSHDWQAAVWDVRTGRLRHVFDVPIGDFADNAALAFSGDGTQFAFAAGREARLWDIGSGKQLASWRLPRGFVDQLAFTPAGKLLLFRVETNDPEVRPFGVPPKDYPRICRIRELIAPDKQAPVKDITDFNVHVYVGVAAPDGRYFVVDGLSGETQKPDRMVKAFEGATGKELFSLKSRRTRGAGGLGTDPTGRLLSAHLDNPGAEHDRMTLMEMPEGKILPGPLEHASNALAPGARFWGQPLRHAGYALFRREDTVPLVILGLGTQATGHAASFNSAGTLLAWGNADGTVSVCDINEIQRRLAPVGLGW